MEPTSRFVDILGDFPEETQREIETVVPVKYKTSAQLRVVVRGRNIDQATALLQEELSLSKMDASALAGVLLASSAPAQATAAPPDLKKMLRCVAMKVDKIDFRLNFTDACPWYDMAETDRSRSKNLRKKVFGKLGLTEKNANCWLTGELVPVKVAHILPDSSKNSVLKRLGLAPKFRNDVEAMPSNFMILCDSLEEAFDAMKISFAPKDLLHTQDLFLKIWDNACREDPVEGENGKTIGDYDGAKLHIPAGWTVSRRSLSYHTLCCYMYCKNKGNLNEEEPADFSSQSSGRDGVRKYLAGLLTSSIKEEENDIADDSDDSMSELNDSCAEGDSDNPQDPKSGENLKRSREMMGDGEQDAFLCSKKLHT